MSEWLGKGCKYQCCQWEENEETGGPNYKDNLPTLIFCNHPENPEDTEGNCTGENCPLPEGPNVLVLVMDGSDHTDYETTGCCSQFGRRCNSCGGWMHYQPIYGGYYYQCETCKKTDV